MPSHNIARFSVAHAFFMLLGIVANADALAAAGRVVNVSGPLFAVAADGSKRVLAVGSEVDQGDTLITEEKTYARVKFSDQGEVTLRPSSQLKVERYAFNESQPSQDSAVLGLFKGALRTVTGLIGKRGNRDAYTMNTATATIGIRGTTYGVVVCPHPSCASELAPGTYIDVTEGAIQVGTLPPTGCAPAGTASTLPPCPPTLPPIVLTAGQYGFVPTIGAPQTLPGNPGLTAPQLPNAFDAPSGSATVSGISTGPCEVR